MPAIGAAKFAEASDEPCPRSTFMAIARMSGYSRTRRRAGRLRGLELAHLDRPGFAIPAPQLAASTRRLQIG